MESGIRGLESRIQGVESRIQRVESRIRGMESRESNPESEEWNPESRFNFRLLSVISIDITPLFPCKINVNYFDNGAKVVGLNLPT